MNSNFYEELLDNLYDGVYFVDTKRVITYWSKGAERISGYNRDEVIGKSCADNILIHVNDQGDLLCKKGCPIQKTLDCGVIQNNEVYLHHKDGHRVPVIVKTTPIRDQLGKIIGAVEMFADNTNMLLARSRVDELIAESQQDKLTGLGNREFMLIKLESALNELKRGQLPFGVLFIDIDFFKSINDAYGHLIGDQVLRTVSLTMQKSLRITDHIGRWGGEEFLAILHGIQPEHLPRICQKIGQLVSQSRSFIDGKNIGVSISLGATMADEADTVASLVSRADQLMYRSKINGRNQYTIG